MIFESRFDCMERILRLVRCEIFWQQVSWNSDSAFQEHLHTFSSVILFFPNHNSSKPVRVSKFSISCTRSMSCPFPNPDPSAYPYPIGCQLQHSQLCKPLQSLDLLYLVLYKENFFQLFKMIDILDMLYLVEAEIQPCQPCQTV